MCRSLWVCKDNLYRDMIERGSALPMGMACTYSEHKQERPWNCLDL